MSAIAGTMAAACDAFVSAMALGSWIAVVLCLAAATLALIMLGRPPPASPAVEPLSQLTESSTR